MPAGATGRGRRVVGGGAAAAWFGGQARATDPAIPEDVAAELRRALMAARRDVGAALRAGCDPQPARARVHAAKVALGERGEPWWEQTLEQRRQRWEGFGG